MRGCYIYTHPCHQLSRMSSYVTFQLDKLYVNENSTCPGLSPEMKFNSSIQPTSRLTRDVLHSKFTLKNNMRSAKVKNTSRACIDSRATEV